MDATKILEAGRKATQGEWETDTEHCEGSYGVGDETREGYKTYAVFCHLGNICDAHNSAITEVREDWDEDGICHAWDEIARLNMEYIVAAQPRHIIALIEGHAREIEAKDAEIARLREALDFIASAHLPDQPAAYGCHPEAEAEHRDRHILFLRRHAKDALLPQPGAQEPGA